MALKEEFDREQEHFRSVSSLNPDEQKRFKDKQQIAFMYMKPPGLDAALSKEKEEQQASTAAQLKEEQVRALDNHIVLRTLPLVNSMWPVPLLTRNLGGLSFCKEACEVYVTIKFIWFFLWIGTFLLELSRQGYHYFDFSCWTLSPFIWVNRQDHLKPLN